MSTLDGDTPCDECGTTENLIWFTDSAFWNTVVRLSDTGEPYGYAIGRWGRDPILCLPCFVAVTEQRGYRPTGWKVTPDWPWEREGER